MARLTVILLLSCMVAIAIASKGADNEGEQKRPHHHRRRPKITTEQPRISTEPAKITTEDYTTKGKGETTTEHLEIITKKPTKCSDDEFWSDCGSACPPTCDRPKPIICTLQCVQGCFCRDGQKRNHKGKCVKHC